MNRQKLVLFILLILLVLSGTWSYLKWPRQKSVTTLKYAPGQKAGKVQEKGATVPVAPASKPDEGRVLRLDLLDREIPAFSGYRRNIFKPVFIDEIKAMKQKAAAVKPIPPPVPSPKPVPIPSPAPPPVLPRRELARFTFLGFFKKDNIRTVFLAKDKDIILVRKGDKFAGRYEATAITDQTLTISVTDTGEEIVIPLIENQPLRIVK